MEESKPQPQVPAMTIDGADEDQILANSTVLTRREVITRRLRRVRQLARCYKSHYWALMNDLRSKYRDYYWTYGKSPFKDDEENPNGVVLGDRVNGTDNGVVVGDDFVRCAFSGCKSKAMALTRFCHTHILSDSKQKLYRGCTTVAKKWVFIYLFFKFNVLLFGGLWNVLDDVNVDWSRNSWLTCMNNLISWILEISVILGLVMLTKWMLFFIFMFFWFFLDLVVWLWKRWIRALVIVVDEEIW